MSQEVGWGICLEWEGHPRRGQYVQTERERPWCDQGTAEVPLDLSMKPGDEAGWGCGDRRGLSTWLRGHGSGLGGCWGGRERGGQAWEKILTLLSNFM